MERIKLISFAICLALAFSACGNNEQLPELDVSVDVICVESPDYVRSGSDEANNDNPNYSLRQCLPKIDLSKISSLPVYEHCLADEHEEDVAKYLLEAEQISDYFKTQFTFDAELSKIGTSHDFSSDNGVLSYCKENDNILMLYGDKNGLDLSEHIINALIQQNGECIASIETQDSLVVPLGRPLTEYSTATAETEFAITALIDDLQGKFPLFLPERYDYCETLRETDGAFVTVSQYYYDIDFDDNRGKLLQYNGFYNCYGISMGEDNYFWAFNKPNLNKPIGEYRIITTAEAAERLDLQDNEKLALMYIRSENDGKTLLRPVYTKYTEQRDIAVGLMGGTYIDAIA